MLICVGGRIFYLIFCHLTQKSLIEVSPPRPPSHLHDGLRSSESDENRLSGTLGEVKAEQQCTHKTGADIKSETAATTTTSTPPLTINTTANNLESLPAASGVDQGVSATW